MRYLLLVLLLTGCSSAHRTDDLMRQSYWTGCFNAYIDSTPSPHSDEAVEVLFNWCGNRALKFNTGVYNE